MKEEIKEELRLFNCGFNTSDRVIKCHNNILKILDKYNNQPDYKSAWNELKNQPTNYITKYLDKFGFVEEKTLNKLIEERSMDYESPYCEICGHCGDIGCCGIRGFIEEHIKGKTNCKNEDGIVQDLISICEYETEVFKKNDTLNKGIDELIKKYEDYTNNIFTNMSILNEMTEQNFQKYDKDIVRVWAKYSVYTDFIQDLKKLKGE